MGIEEIILEELKKEGREGELKAIEEFVDACFEAKEQGRELNWDLCWSESIFELWEKAEEKGIEKGHKEGLEIAAASMLSKGFSPEQVADILPLSLAEVLEVRDRLDKSKNGNGQ